MGGTDDIPSEVEDADDPASSRRSRALVASNHLEHFAGSELVALEVAEELRARDFDVEVVANWSARPLTAHLRRSGLHVGRPTGVRAFDFDVVWCQHMTAPLLSFDVDERSRERTTFAFVHLSPTTPLEIVGTTHEDVLADLVIANSHETGRWLLGHGTDPERLRVLHNAAPASFAMKRRGRRRRLARLLIVSSHLPEEVRGAIPLLESHGVEVRHVGRGGLVRRVDVREIHRADAVLTIGKTTQYALLSRTPVFVYDHLGGPGWLNSENLADAEWHNFSGRCCRTLMTPAEIVRRVTEGYPAASAWTSALSDAALKPFRLEDHLDALLAATPPTCGERVRVLGEHAMNLERDAVKARLIADGQRVSLRRKHESLRLSAESERACSPEAEPN